MKLTSLAGPCAWLALAILSFSLSGCTIFGYAAAAVSGDSHVDASYKGLPNQKCAIMVWADDGVLNDYHAIQLDAAHGIEDKLQQAAKANTEEVANITWVPAEKILDYQQTHPGLDAEAVEDVAPNLGVTRLIYVEIEAFQIHANESPDLWRGTMTATLTVVAVDKGKGKVAYSERDVSALYPKNCPPEGLPDLEDAVVYRSTVDAFTTEIAKRFIPHDVDVDESTQYLAPTGDVQ
ncbi:MAG: hypothetical protein ABSH22_03740 [Tepidisphaeraceae bacterium]|jgi:hypothetical protein